MDYRYDRFGRVTQDGALTFSHDANGNVATIGYPGGVSATITYDFADRPLTLAVQVGTEPAQDVVTGATYLPSGLLSTLALANGATETRLHDGRYTPTAILLEGPAPRSWLYTTDPVGNILEIEEHESCAQLPLELSGQTIPDTQTLTTCSGVTADTTTVTGTGDLTLTGTRIALGDGFQVETGGRLVAGTDATGLGQVITRSYRYQDFTYFLDTATGPWGSLSWSYDRIGNGLTETTNGATDTYTYAPNAATGNTALLTQIQLASGGTRNYTHGPAGHLTQVTAGANVIDFTSDAEGRLSQLDRLTEQAPFSYDGRSYLRTATDTMSGDTTEPTYDTAGLLHALRRVNGGVEEHITYLHFAGRPVAQLKTDAAGSTLTWLTADHLGTPVLAKDVTGAQVWDANYSPFGTDLDEGLPGGGLANEIYLRFPGQWDDGRWGAADLGAEVFYNVHRWYLPGVGRYGRGDPLGFPDPEDIEESYFNLLLYVAGNPLLNTDPLGLLTLPLGPGVSPRCRKKWENKIMPRMQKLAYEQECRRYFCDRLGTDLPSLVNEVIPFIAVTSRSGGAFRCEPELTGRRPDLHRERRFPTPTIEVGKRFLCRSTRNALHILIHEMGHFADCLNLGDAFKKEEDGCGAEVACFGFSIGDNCKRLGFPTRQ